MAQVAPVEIPDHSTPSLTADENEIELQNIQNRDGEREQATLPPTDGGYQAWLLLAGCFVINVLIWGRQ